MLSPIRFNILVEKIVHETPFPPHLYPPRPISSLRFTDYIDLTGDTSSELQALTKRL
ncbi:hypothetical protein DPMN_144571 [Dreissena polymorpha]|uniref:Uncharacterized protein n=1 Tax=Dreissena polymorpha TaxID=45954 RepID=A0A9D4GEV3_DREPO|nr:hypothetical protein DPMN_144571 [Dreissena polymorpha]